MNTGLSRRNFIKAMGTGAVGASMLSVGNGLVVAQDDMMGSFNAIYNFTLGDWDMMVVKDVGFAFDATIFGSNQPEEDVLGFFENIGILSDDNTINGLVDILVARNGDNVVIFDTGQGVANGGALISSLASVGINAEDVTTVVNSHWHPDHTNGLSEEGVLTFPNATVMFPQAEFDFMESLPDVTGGAMAKLQPALDAEQVQFYTDGASMGDVTAMATPGHTPGHMAFMIDSGGDQLIHLVDSVLNVYSSTANPGWHARFDADGDLATETRINLMGMAADEGIRVFGYHFPFPGLGHIVRDGDAFRFYPVAF